MAKIRIVGDSSGYVELAAPNAAGNNTLELPSNATKLVGADASNSLNVTGVVTATGGFSGNINSTGVSTITTLRSTNIVGVTTAGITTVYTNSINDGAISGARNRIINGSMTIDQRNNGASVTANGNTPYSADRWYGDENTDGAFTLQRSGVAPVGFSSSLLFTTSTADSSLSSGQYAVVATTIEGFNIADFNWGSANAKTVTLSFWTRSSLTGTFGGSLRNSSINRTYPFTYSISAENTWEYKTITVPGETSGTWLINNGFGLNLLFDLGSGSTYRGGTANTWNGVNYHGPSGTVSPIETLNATWYLTGVQLEIGNNASLFEHRSYAQELSLCQRYFQRIYDPPMRGVGTGATTGGASRLCLFFPTSMRVAPTLTITGTFNFWNGSTTATGGTLSGYFQGGYDGIDLDITTSGSFTIGQAVCAYCTNNTTNKYVDLFADF